jgi:hypothetical protein
MKISDDDNVEDVVLALIPQSRPAPHLVCVSREVGLFVRYVSIETDFE